MLYPCKNWNKLFGMCERKNNNLSQIGNFSSIQLSEQDFDLTCKGKSNICLCSWFIYSHESIMDLNKRIKREGVKHGINQKRT